MTFFKIEAGRYMFGQTYIVKHKPIPGRQQTTTWRDAVTGEWLGYTLAEAKETVKRRRLGYKLAEAEETVKRRTQEAP